MLIRCVVDVYFNTLYGVFDFRLGVFKKSNAIEDALEMDFGFRMVLRSFERRCRFRRPTTEGEVERGRAAELRQEQIEGL